MPRQTFQDRWASGGAKTDPGDVKTALGWIQEKPPYQFFNWLLGRSDDQHAHIEEQGVGDWHTDTAYLEGGLAMGSDRLVYRAVQANTAIDPTTDGGTNWVLYVRAASQSVPGIVEIATNAETITGLDAGRAVSPASLAALGATGTRAGLIELSSNAETQALSAADRAVTPSSLGTLDATLAQRGIISLATPAEVIAGNEAGKAVTPSSLNTSSLIANPGYSIEPGGLVKQWGVLNTPGTGTQVTLPLTFPNNIWGAVIGSSLSGNAQWDIGVEIVDTSTIAISSIQTNQDIYWWAWGN